MSVLLKINQKSISYGVHLTLVFRVWTFTYIKIHHQNKSHKISFV